MAFRNRIINGGFSVNQRGYVSGMANSSAGLYAHDRWKGGAGGCTYTFTQQAPNTNISITAGTLLQIIEASAVEGGTYSLSWAGTATARIYQGAASGSYAASPITVTGLSANTATTVEFSTGTLGQVQLEPGASASAFERRPLTIETALCQRFFVQWTTSSRADLFAGLAYQTTAAVFPVPLPVPMRATPTVSSLSVQVLNGSGSQVAGTSQAVSNATDKTVELVIGVSSGLTPGQASVLTIGASGGNLSLSSEL